MGKIVSNANKLDTSATYTSKENLNKLAFDKDFIDLKKSIAVLSSKYSISTEEITKLINIEKEIEIPTSIYSDKNLSLLEATVRYLKDELNLKYSAIGMILNRDERTIWSTYNNSLKKSILKLNVSQSITLPIALLSDRKFSLLEQVTGYLKENHSLRFSQIAKILMLDDRTIWTCYSRLKKKREGKNEAN